MPRKVNVDLEYARRMSEIDRRYKEALEDAELQLKKRKEKLEAWKAGELALQADAEKARKEKEGKPRMTKFDKEIEEAKKRQKEQFAKSKEDVEKRKENNLPTLVEERRAGIFDFFSDAVEAGQQEEDHYTAPEPLPIVKDALWHKIQEEKKLYYEQEKKRLEGKKTTVQKVEKEESDEWDLSGMSDDAKVSYLKSKIKYGEQPPSDLLDWLATQEKGEKKVTFSPQIEESENQAEEAKEVVPHLSDSENAKKGENFSEISPLEVPVVRTAQTIPRPPTTVMYAPPSYPEDDERPIIISNTKAKKPVKTALKM